jgi:ribonuclease HI
MDEKLFGDSKLIISTDGGARGNPGPAAIGFIVGEKRYGEAIGHTTNNVAEYKAVIAALKKAKQLLGKTKAKGTDIELRLDSELIYKQVGGKYKILEPELQTLFIEVWNLLQDFKSVQFKKVPREENKEADKMVNQALDGSPTPHDEAERLF